MTVLRRLRAVHFVAALAIIVSGCTSSPPVDPPVVTSAGSPIRLPSSAPPVPKSWDAGSYRDKPCALFTDDQARVLGYLKPGTPYMGQPDAAICMRSNENGSSGDFTIKYYFASDLLGKIYRREIPWPANTAQPITVAGQPALKTNDLNDTLCNVAVALTDTQGVEVKIADKNADPCDRAVSVAQTIMRNLGA